MSKFLAGSEHADKVMTNIDAKQEISTPKGSEPNEPEASRAEIEQREIDSVESSKGKDLESLETGESRECEPPSSSRPDLPLSDLITIIPVPKKPVEVLGAGSVQSPVNRYWGTQAEQIVSSRRGRSQMSPVSDASDSTTVNHEGAAHNMSLEEHLKVISSNLP